MTRRLARPVAVTFGLTALTLGYQLWVLEIDGLHSQPPTLLPALLAAPLWTLVPAAVAGLLGYAVGTLDERPGPPSSFEFKLALGFAVPVALVATVALGKMFFGYETKAAGAPTTLLALGRYPDVLLALSATAGAYGHLFGLGWRSLGGSGDEPPDRDVETAPTPGDSPARDPTRGRQDGVARAGRTGRTSGTADTARRSTGGGATAAASGRTASRNGASGSTSGAAGPATASEDGAADEPTDDGSAVGETGGADPTSVDTWPAAVPEAPALAVDRGTFQVGERLDGPPGATARAAEAPGPDGPVAVRLTEPDVDGTLHADGAAAMLDAVEDWERLAEHDHVVDVVASGDTPLPWVATERLDAGRLPRYAGRVPFDAALRVALAVVGAVRFAHRRGVTHRRLHPGAVGFRTAETGPRTPKVDDWGLSRALERFGDRDGPAVPAYAAPEQFDGSRDPPPERTDVYRLGATLYTLFTGEAPFAPPDADAPTARDALDDEPTPPSETADVPAALDEVLLPTLARIPDERPEALVYLRDDLVTLLDAHG